MKPKPWQHAITYTLVFILWDLASRTGYLKPTVLPAPFDVLSALMKLLARGGLLTDAAMSLWRVAVGFSIACLTGVGLGILTGTSRRYRQYGTPLIEILRPIPPVAFVPLSILWFGIGNGPAYFLVAFAAFFPIYTNALAGILAVSDIHRDAALCLGAGRRIMLTDVIVPASVPYLATGLRTGLGTAWFVVIVAELVGAQSGLGYMIQLNRLTLQMENMLAGMITIGVLGYLMNRAMLVVQRRIAPWQTQSQT